MAGGIIAGWKEGWRVKSIRLVFLILAWGAGPKVLHAVGRSNEAAAHAEELLK